MLLVVPGVASAGRAKLTASNIAAVRPAACIVFTHKRCGEDPALDAILDAGDASNAALISNRCEVVRAANGPRPGYVYHLKRLLPSFVDALAFSHVFVLLDDVRIAPAGPADVARFVRVADANGLSVATPKVLGSIRHVMRKSLDCRVGRLVSRIEIFAVLFTPPAYRCWFELIDPATNGVGWGYEKLLEPYCGQWSRPDTFRIGIVSSLQVEHIGKALNRSQVSTYNYADGYAGEHAAVAELKARGLPHSWHTGTARNYGCLNYTESKNASGAEPAAK